MGNMVANSLGVVLSALGLLIPLTAWGGGGWSKTVASYLSPPPVNSLSSPIHSTSSGPVFDGEPGNIPLASSRVNDRCKESLKITALPNELVVNILANLSIRDLLVCKHVCKNWQTLVTTVPALACAAYRGCHPVGHVPRLNDAIRSYHGSIRQWLNGFSEQGSKAVTRLDGMLASGGPHFPKQLFFAIASVLDTAPAFDCRKVCTIEHPDPVYGAGFSPDQQHLLSCSAHTTHICSLIDGCWQNKNTLQQPALSLRCACFSADSKYLVGILDNNNAKIWAFADGQWQQQADWQPVFLRLCPLFNADATQLVTVSRDNNAQIHRLIDGQWQPQVTALDQHSVCDARFHPQEADCLITYWHNIVTLWRCVAGRWQQHGTLLHILRVFNIDFSPDGNRLMIYSGGPDQPGAEAIVSIIHVWHRMGNGWRKEAALVPSDVGDITYFSPCGYYILTNSGQCPDALEIWRVSGGQWQDIKTLLPKYCVNGCFSPDEHHLATQDWMHNAIIWRCTDGLLHKEVVIPHCSPSHGISFSPHGNHLVAATSTKEAIIWGIFAGRWQKKATLPHDSELLTMRFSPQGSYVLTAARDGTVNIWTLNRQ